jgi:hypothetical protein
MSKEIMKKSLAKPRVNAYFAIAADEVLFGTTRAVAPGE